jgi:thioredoxin-dependent peroxiredoxin
MTHAPSPYLPLGSSLPLIPVADATGSIFDYNSLKSKWVFMYFYPKAMTPGCTVQSIAMNRLQAGAPQGLLQVAGVSPDTPQLNAKFCIKDSLSIPLLCDTDHAVAQTFGVWTEKSMYGKKYMGMLRSTFVFDPSHKLVAVFDHKSVDDQLAAATAFYQENVLK